MREFGSVLKLATSEGTALLHAPLFILVPLVAASKWHVHVGLAALVQRYQQASAAIAKTNGQQRRAHLLVRGGCCRAGEGEGGAFEPG